MRLVDADALIKKAVPHTRGSFGYCADIQKWAVLVSDINDTPTAFVPDNNVGGKWIPVTERLPDSERWVLAWYKNLTMPGGRAEKAIYMCDDYDPYWRPLERDITEVTHWMELPSMEELNEA